MRRGFAAAAALLVGLGSAARAQEEPPPAKEGPAAADAKEREAVLPEVEVVATGFEAAPGEATVPVTTIPAGWWETRSAPSLADGLRQVPGVTVTRGGTPGAATSLFLRGAGSNQVLVLQDGIPLNDPTLGGQFNFFDLDPLSLDRVEVLRGSYGALYGSQAIGGVVNLVSRRGEGPAAFRAAAEAGSFLTHRGTLTGSGGDDDSDWSFGLAETGTDGPHDRQAFRSLSFSGRFGARVAGDGRLDLVVRALDSTAEDPYDFGNPIPRDGNIRRDRDLVALGVTAEKPILPWLTARGRASMTDIDSGFRNGDDANPAATPEFQSTNEATVEEVGLSFRAGLLDGAGGGPRLEVVAGGDLRSEESLGFSESPFGSGLVLDATTRNSGFLALATGDLGPVTLTGGGRRDDHSQGGREWSPQAGLRVAVEPTGSVLRANYGQGFRSPTPSEFSDPFVGNPDLGPEESESVDAGIEQSIGPRVTAEASWFRLRTRDLIAFDGTTFLLDNIARAEVTGVEAGLRVDAGGGLVLRGSFTRQRPRDEGTGERLANRPDAFGTLGVEWSRGDWTVAADAYRQGTVDDLGARGPDQRLRDSAGRRTVVDLALRFRASKGVAVFARVQNLLDEEYVETPTSPTGLPFSVFAGVALEF
jgi:vitamin B12 transporter